MPLNAGDVKNITTMETWGMSSAGTTVRVYQISFMVRDQGPYTVTVPTLNFTPQVAEAAIRTKAEAIIGTLDLFK